MGWEGIYDIKKALICNNTIRKDDNQPEKFLVDHYLF